MTSQPTKHAQSVTPDAIAAEIERLSDLPTTDLKAAWAAEFERQPPKGLWRDLLLRMLAWRLQERAFGGHDKPTLRYLEQFGQKRAGDARCQRLKPGTVLVREFSGARHSVTIAADGIVWQEKEDVSTPVLFLTAMGRVDERIEGLESGGDDYLAKPFLIARVRALERRNDVQGNAEPVFLKTGKMTLDLIRQTVTYDGKEVAVQLQEFRLLEYLARNANQIVTRSMILENVWNINFDPGTNIIETHMSRLRSKLPGNSGKTLILTVRGIGYTLCAH